MHIKKPHKQNVEALDVGPTPEALEKANIEFVPAPRNTNMPSMHRKVSMHDKLLKDGKISQPERDWVERYAKDCDIERGANPGKSLVERCENDGQSSDWSLVDTQIQSATRLRRARDRMTQQERDILESACVYAHRIADVAIVCGIFPGDDETMKSFSNRVEKKIFRRVTDAIRAGFGDKRQNKSV